MADSFFRTNWNHQPSRPHYSPSFVRAPPVQPVQHRKPKVVSIPVRFVGGGSENNAAVTEVTRLPAAAAAKIQKVFRAHMVRKSVRRIASIRREVDEIERRVSSGEAADLIRKEPKERLRVNESLMALLLKLDSVRGVDAAVRDCRKAVIRKAIALQERVDAIAAAGDRQTLGDNQAALEEDDSDSDDIAEIGDQTLDSADCKCTKDQTLDSADCKCTKDQTVETEGKTSDIIDLDVVSIQNQAPVIENSDNSVDVTDQMVEIDRDIPVGEQVGVDDKQVVNSGESEAMPEAKDEIPELQVSGGAMESPEKCEDMDVVTDDGVDSVDDEKCVIKQIVETGSDCVTESMETSPAKECLLNVQSFVKGCEENALERSEEDKKECPDVGGREDNKRNRELLEKMMEDNEKLMAMMAQLCDKNEKQTRMINSLTHRVEQLERAFICDKSRRKKKRHTS